MGLTTVRLIRADSPKASDWESVGSELAVRPYGLLVSISQTIIST